MNNIQFSSKSIPFALLFFCIISFGVLIPWLGFYWDDWPAIWYLNVFGASGFGDVFAVDRPLLGWLFSITTPFLGTSAAAWQTFGILTRWLCVLAFWWFLRALWPDHPQQTAWAALLFAVYPGFKQQFISVTYSHAWILETTFLLSLGSMAWALRKRARFWLLIVGSWALSAYTLFSVEYYFGLELLRPIIIWMLLYGREENPIKRLKRTSVIWMPYLLISLAFLAWRLAFYPTERGNVQFFSKLVINPATTLTDLAETVIIDVFNAGIVAWAQIMNFAKMMGYGRGPTMLYLAGIALATAAAIFYLVRLRPAVIDSRVKTVPSHWSRQSLLLGVLALLLAGIPFWVTNLPIGLEFPWDRFTLAMMFGSSLLIAGLVDLLARTHLQKAVILGILIGFSSGLHLQYSNLYRREWNMQSDFFRQLTWRAPAIEENTVLLTAELPFVYFSDNSLTAPLNWIYAPEFNSREMPYLLYAAEARHEQSLEDFEPGLEIHQPYRATEFNGSTSQAIVLYYTPPGCLKVVDPATDKKTPQKPKFISDMMPLSRPDLILPDTKQPANLPGSIFGDAPEDVWCYYFERAELARQAGEWQQVATLGDQALRLDHSLYEVNAPELITYIEGYAYTGRWKDASRMTQEALNLSERMDRILCDTWKRIMQNPYTSAEKLSTLANMKELLPCLQ